MARNVCWAICIQNVKAASILFSELWMIIRVCLTGPFVQIPEEKRTFPLESYEFL